MNQKKLVLIIGINGAGKTTLRHQIQLLENAQIIDSDDFLISRNGNWRRTEDRIRAILEANQELKRKLSQGKNIIWEFEAAGHLRQELKIINESRQLGYAIQLVWVTVKDVQLSLERVLQRFKNGGIGGTQIGLTERFERVALNFIKIESYSDQVTIFDNSIRLKKIYERTSQQEVINNLKNYPWIFPDNLENKNYFQ